MAEALPVLEAGCPWPQDEQWPPSRPDGSRDPYQALLASGDTALIVTDHEQVRRVVTEDGVFSRELAGQRALAPGLEACTQGSFIDADGDQHRQLLSLVSGALTPRRLETRRPRIKAIIGELVGSLATGPQPADLVSQVILPMTEQAIGEVLGVPAGDMGQVRAWADVIIGGTPAMYSTATWEAFGELFTYAGNLLASRLARPAGDLPSELAAAARDTAVDSWKSSSLMAGLMIGGIVSNPVVAAMSVLALLAHPDEMARLRASPNLVRTAVEEALRWTHFTAQGPTMLSRVTRCPVMLGGTLVPAGARVVPAFGAANRDPGKFPDPDRFDITRKAAHLAFGAGTHYCPGAAAARVMQQEFLLQVATRLPGLRLAVPAARLRWRQMTGVHQLEAMPVFWDVV